MSPHSGRGADQRRSTRRALIATWCAFVIAGSLYPFDFVSPTDQQLAAFFGDTRWITGRADAAENALLFFPLGVLLALRQRSLMQWCVLWMFTAAFAWLVQLAQVWTPDRIPAFADVVWNMIGFTVGALLPPLLKRWHHRMPSMSLEPAAAIVLALWIIGTCAPWLPTLDVSSLRDNAKAFLYGSSTWDRLTVHALTAAAVMFCVERSWHVNHGPWRGLMIIAIVCAARLSNSLFPVTWTTLAAIVGGGTAGTLFARYLPKSAEVLFVVAVTAFIIGALAPFELLERPTAFDWIPGSGVLGTAALSTVASLAMELTPVAWCIWYVRRQRGSVTAITAVWCCVAAATEYAQTWIPGRTGAITLPIAVAVLGFAMRSLHYGASAGPR